MKKLHHVGWGIQVFNYSELAIIEETDGKRQDVVRIGLYDPAVEDALKVGIAEFILREAEARATSTVEE
jgi:hypothetical protein